MTRPSSASRRPASIFWTTYRWYWIRSSEASSGRASRIRCASCFAVAFMAVRFYADAWRRAEKGSCGCALSKEVGNPGGAELLGIERLELQKVVAEKARGERNAAPVESLGIGRDVRFEPLLICVPAQQAERGALPGIGEAELLDAAIGRAQAQR